MLKEMRTYINNQFKCERFFFRSCSGLIISSFSKHVPDETFKKRMSKSIELYKRYKKMLELPKKFTGKIYMFTRILKTH